MLDAVLRSIWPEIPSGPVAVLVLWVESRLRTSFSSQVIEERVGVSAGGDGISREVEAGGLEKQEEKNRLRRLALPTVKEADWF